ncbi:hypothetical protein SAMN05216241_105123 [Limimonas halophila]|uniref:Uncharacterized protein n=1 Tax=Limimonas halophila TaxID=1082479 RepID=A0A1G7RGD9_9PROT|nr:hypothetical protein [Limimonas halophila]SDG09838.1 hypothetical protein SAMN05216241_105123 [Limimonas halophila]
MTFDTTRRIAGAAVAAAGVLALAACSSTQAGNSDGNAKQPDITVKQDSGKVTYWVMPGPRKLGEEVFGTPENPKMTLAPKLKKAKETKGPPSVPQLLKDLPTLVGVPEKARSKGPDGGQILKAPTPFSDDGRIIQGSFKSKLYDNINEDPPGPPGKTPDTATMEAEFTDPQGNEYRVVLDHVVKPPFPGYETDGGVFLDGYLHGTTGIGSPLMPQVWTIAAWWGVGELYVNGELVNDHRVMHLMTTEVVRDNNYKLAQQADLPLAPENWLVKGQPHHTHLILPPIQGTKKGPVFDPVESAFELPNGKNQPFIHVMFEQDTIVR